MTTEVEKHGQDQNCGVGEPRLVQAVTAPAEALPLQPPDNHSSTAPAVWAGLRWANHLKSTEK